MSAGFCPFAIGYAGHSHNGEVVTRHGRVGRFSASFNGSHQLPLAEGNVPFRLVAPTLWKWADQNLCSPREHGFCLFCFLFVRYSC